MIMHKTLKLALICGLLISTSQPVKAITPPPFVTHTATLASTALGLNFMIFYSFEKLRHWKTDCKTFQTTLMAALFATGCITDAWLLRSGRLGNPLGYI